MSNNSSTHVSSSSLTSDASNYMNITNDGLFPGDLMDGVENNIITDDMALVYPNTKSQSIGNSMLAMHSGNTQSLPNGLPPGSIAQYNKSMNQQNGQHFPSVQQYSVEHLASFPQDERVGGFLTPADALAKLKKISSGGGLWAQKMNMNISSEKLVMANGDTLEVIEEYPMPQISLCITVLDDPMFENLLIFSTKLSRDKVGAVHLFQCQNNESQIICEMINKQREQKARLVNGYGNRKPDTVSLSSSEQSSKPSYSQIQTRTEYNLKERHAVAQAVKAFQSPAPAPDPRATNTNAARVTPFQDAKITRDVEILNKCIEEVENFVVMLKRINEARKQLQAKKRSSKKKVENILLLQSQPPPDHRVLDIYQKFKHALNLLGKLQPHITDPNASELIHYLFIPLGIIVKVTSIEKARSVVDPLLTNTTVNLLVNCLDSREYHFWQSLGPNWTLTKSSEQYKDRYFNPYIPVFADGWVPPEVILDEKHEAAVKTTSAMVARMNGHEDVRNSNGHYRDQLDSAPSHSLQPVYQTAMKTPLLTNRACAMISREPAIGRLFKSYGMRFKVTNVPTLMTDIRMSVNTANMHSQLPARQNSFNENQRHVEQRLVGIVVYDYLAHNNKELTIRAGEKVFILDNSRRWWLVRNAHGEQGYVPSTVLEIPAQESGAISPADSVNSFSMSPQRSSSSSYSPSYDVNQNYVNDDDLMATSNNQPKKTVTPVIISVQLSEGGRVQSNANGTHIIATPASYTNPPKKQQQQQRQQQQQQGWQQQHKPPPQQQLQQQQRHSWQQQSQSSPQQQQQQRVNIEDQYAAVRKKPLTQKTSSDGDDLVEYQATSRKVSSGVNQARIQQQRVSPPSIPAPPPMASPTHAQPPFPPPPPPPAVGPPVLPKQYSVFVPREANLQSLHGTSNSPNRMEPKEDLHDELRDRLTIQNKSQHRPTSQHRADVDGATQSSIPNIDSVDVFIPLYKSSTADDVSRWLRKLGFSERTIDILKGKTATDLFKIDKESMIGLIGNDDGIQLFEELQVQNGAQSRHKTLTEFQKALVRRLQKREGQEVNRSHHHSSGSEPSDSPVNSMTRDDSSDLTQKMSAIRKQQEELERLKRKSREPGSATFSSFSNGTNVGTPQGKTKL